MTVFEEREGRVAIRAIDGLRGFTLVLTDEGDVAEARGDVTGLLGYTPKSLVGRSLAELMHPDAATILSEILVAAASDCMLPESVFYFADVHETRVAFHIIGRPVPRRFDRMQLLCVYAAELDRVGPLGRDGFADRIDRALRRGEEGDYSLTFVDLGDIGQLRALGLDEDSIRSFATQVEDHLRRASADGATAERVEDGRYGLLTRRGDDLGSLRESLEAQVRDIDPHGQVLKVAATSFDLDRETLAGEEATEILRHAVDVFADGGLDAVIFDDLASVSIALSSRRQDRAALLREALSTDDVVLRYSPIVALTNARVDHLLAELAIEQLDDDMDWEEIQDVCARTDGLRHDVDLAVARLALAEAPQAPLPVAIEVDVASLTDRTILAGLLGHAQKYPDHGIILRIEGFDQDRLNRVSALQSIRRAGLKVALKGTEIGVISPDKLVSLPADFIRMDPSLVLEPVALKAQRPMISIMVQRCRQHGISVQFEGVTRADVMELLTGIPGVLASGPVFGPSERDPDLALVPVAERGAADQMEDEGDPFSPLGQGF